ncbi:GWT1-domain-containing protein [Phakopsora pachyrhizi]|uniref:GPI-anchored wall transfer protein 1 n=1 Tax=Phakopsora pachyrhizi TaxID=170000 RepID=A0AAV0BN65_PHAPC|nr:GWT1-domain-containing protein [Phakopsora pachyrhizi]
MMISTMDEKKLYYKSLKEEFVSDNEGCSLKELLLINLTGWLSNLIWRLSHNTSVIFLGLTKLPTQWLITLEFLTLVFPILGIVTFLSDQIWLTNLVMGTVTVILWCLLTWLDYGDVKLGRMRSDGGGYDEMMMASSTNASRFLEGSNPNQQTGIRTEQQESDSIRKSFNNNNSFKDDDGEDDLSRTLIRSDQRLEIIEEDEIRLMVTSISFKKPFLSIYRAQLMLITSIAILAVDFNSFPRRFSKTESWGISLMDLGVGSFVFSSGISASSTILKYRTRDLLNNTNHRNLNNCQTILNKLEILRSVRRTLPLVLIGFVRIWFTKSVDYPEHVTEYGVHWNFFFTMAVLSIFGIIIQSSLKKFNLNLIILGFTICSSNYQYVLSFGGLQDYVLSNEPRDNLISANREGLSSIPGYITIYIFGLSTGLYTLPPYPDYLSKLSSHKSSASDKDQRPMKRFKKKFSVKDKRGKLIVVILSWMVIWWTGYFFCLRFISDPSRRLVNSTYCFLITAINVSLIGFHCLIEELDQIYFSSKIKHLENERRNWSGRVPRIFDRINTNGLLFFLIANLMTGLINMKFQTIFLSDSISIMILIGYISILISIVHLI